MTNIRKQAKEEAKKMLGYYECVCKPNHPCADCALKASVATSLEQKMMEIEALKAHARELADKGIAERTLSDSLAEALTSLLDADCGDLRCYKPTEEDHDKGYEETVIAVNQAEQALKTYKQARGE